MFLMLLRKDKHVSFDMKVPRERTPSVAWRGMSGSRLVRSSKSSSSLYSQRMASHVLPCPVLDRSLAARHCQTSALISASSCNLICQGTSTTISCILDQTCRLSHLSKYSDTLLTTESGESYCKSSPELGVGLRADHRPYFYKISCDKSAGGSSGPSCRGLTKASVRVIDSHCLRKSRWCGSHEMSGIHSL